MQALRTLTCNDVEIASLAGIEKLDALVHITFVNTGISNLGPVSDLEGPRSLHTKEEVLEISGRAGPSLSGLTRLTELWIADSQVRGLSRLENLTNL